MNLERDIREARELIEVIEDDYDRKDFDWIAGYSSPSYELCRLAPRIAAQLETAAEEEDNGEPYENELVERPVVSPSMLSDKWFYFTHWRETGNGKGMEQVGYRVDVTDAATVVVNRELAAFYEFLRTAGNMDEGWTPDEAIQAYRSRERG